MPIHGIHLHFYSIKFNPKPIVKEANFPACRSAIFSSFGGTQTNIIPLPLSPQVAMFTPLTYSQSLSIFSLSDKVYDSIKTVNVEAMLQ